MTYQRARLRHNGANVNIDSNLLHGYNGGMNTTELGKNGPRVSRLGFGCMRFPMRKDGKVDRDATIPMLRRAVELGVNYFDTAVMYCNDDSQSAVGEALEPFRDRVVISTKNHLHREDEKTWWSRLEDSLRMLRTDCIDLYHLHGIGRKVYEEHIAGPTGKMKLMQRAKEQGMIRHICCSFHDEPSAFKMLADTGEFDVMTVQYNLLNREMDEGIAYAHERGIGIVVMGPVGGGRLGLPSERIRELTGGSVHSTPEAALRFVLAHPGVDVALSGMENMEQLEENVRIVADRRPFTTAEVAAIDREIARIKERIGVPCTACGYCVPCPRGVDIPENFRLLNDLRIYGLEKVVQRSYTRIKGRADYCVNCGICVPKCPQKIDIPAALNRVLAEVDQDYISFGATLVLSGGRPDGVNGRVIARNLQSQTSDLTLKLDLDGTKVSPSKMVFRKVQPMETVVRNVRMDVAEDAGFIEGECEVSAGDSSRKHVVRRPFFLAPEDAWREHGRVKDAESGLAMDVALCREGDELHLRVRAEGRVGDQPGDDPRRGARLEIFVDARPRGDARSDDWEEGVDTFFVHLPDGATASRSGEEKGFKAKVHPEDNGCRVEATIPLPETAPRGQVPKKRIALDLMLVGSSENVEEKQLIHSGASAPWAHPRYFTPLFFVNGAGE